MSHAQRTKSQETLEPVLSKTLSLDHRVAAIFGIEVYSVKPPSSPLRFHPMFLSLS